MPFSFSNVDTVAVIARILIKHFWIYTSTDYLLKWEALHVLLDDLKTTVNFTF